MDLQKRIEVLLFLKDKFNEVLNGKEKNFPGFNNIFYHNPWFTEEFVRYALNTWSKTLYKQNINIWLEKYPCINDELSDKTVAMIFAGNIPMVGLHDLLCTLICGYKCKIKLSSKDNILNKWVINSLVENFPELVDRIIIVDDKLDNFDAVIATGSGNSYRYFQYYFGKYKNILRQNKNSIAILTGKENKKELSLLADDIFLYFGMGCRSVSHLLLPEKYDFNELLIAFQKYQHLIDHNKFANNYDYQKAIFQISKIQYYDAGNILLIKNTNIASPIAVLYYSFYKNNDDLKGLLTQNQNKLQCIIGNDIKGHSNHFFGKSQQPQLNEYADGIDTVKFLLKI